MYFLSETSLLGGATNDPNTCFVCMYGEVAPPDDYYVIIFLSIATR